MSQSPHDRLIAAEKLLGSVAQSLRNLSLPTGSDALWHVAQAVGSIEEAREHIGSAKAPLTLG